MNSVHEPGSNGDSETISSRKTRSKTNPGARAPKLAQLGTQARTGTPRPGRIVAGSGHVLAEAPSRIAAPGCRVVAPRERPCPVSRAPCPAPQRRVAAPTAVLWPSAARTAWPCHGLASRPCRDTKSGSYPFLAAIQCSVLQYTAPYCQPPSWSRYNISSSQAYLSVTIQSTSVTIHLVYCDTKTLSHCSLFSFSLSQYNYCIVIQTFLAKPTAAHFKSCNTILNLLQYNPS